MDHAPSIVPQVHYSGFEAYEKLKGEGINA